MTEERVPYHAGQEPAPESAEEHPKTLRTYFIEQEPVPEQASPHKHLYRVVFGNALAIRFCERCGKAWLLQEVRDLISNHSVYEWSEVQEPGTIEEKSPAETDQEPRLKGYLNE